MKLVLDASIALNLCASKDGFHRLRHFELIAPALLWSEMRSVLHRAVWLKQVDEQTAQGMLENLERASVKPRNPKLLGPTAWRIATELGWAKTYDAEYLALAKISGCQMLTADRRLRRGADRLNVARLLDEL